MSTKILADAVSNLFPQVLKEKKLDIRIIPIELRIDGDCYNLYNDSFDLKEFNKKYYEAVANNKCLSTSLVGPGEYASIFKEEVEKGNKVICFTMAQGISGTYNSACIARDMVNEEYGSKVVEVIESMTAGFGEGLQAVHAYELTKKGNTFEEIIKDAEIYKHYIRSDFTVDKIKFLLNTGRVSKTLARFASLLNIKVLLKRSKDSKIEFSGTSLGKVNAIKQLARIVLTKINKTKNQIVYITHCNIINDARKLKELLIKGGVKNVEIYDYDFISGAHLGQVH